MLIDVNPNGELGASFAVAIKHSCASTLNPYAPSFFPISFSETEDFSKKWWDLVQTSPTFRDYWLLERLPFVENESLLPEVVDELESLVDFIEEESFSSDDDFEESLGLLQATGSSHEEELKEEDHVL